MAIYTCYYDASGSEKDTRTLTACGVIASEKHWRTTEVAWKRVLGRFGVPYFHAQDFVQSKGPFAAWAQNQTVRTGFVKALVAALQDGLDMSMVITGPRDILASINQRFDLGDFSGAYAHCMSVCIRKSHEWIMNRDLQHMPAHIVEAGDQGQGKLWKILESEGLTFYPRPKRDPVSGEWLPGLQAADFLAWEHRRGFEGMFLDGKRLDELRTSFKELLNRVPYEAWDVREDKLINSARSSVMNQR